MTAERVVCNYTEMLMKADRNILYNKIYDSSDNIRDNVYKVVLTLSDGVVIEVAKKYIKNINLLKNTFEFMDIYQDINKDGVNAHIYESICIIPLRRIKIAQVVYK